MNTEQYIEDLKSRNEIISVVSEYAKIKCRDNKYIAECVFSDNNEKSLIILDQNTQSYFDIKNNIRGDVINFYARFNGISQYEAIRKLSEKAGLKMPELNISQKEAERDIILKINKEAACFYYKELLSNRGKEGQEYFLNKRNLTKETIKSFGLGYAPKSWDALTRYLLSNGYSKEDMMKSGLFVLDNYEKLRDKFVNRVMFPIQNDKGDIVAFGGRVLDDSKPKYMNSPETPAFFKSESLYGWNRIKNANAGNLIICEGYMDVIAMQQAGFKQACASLGTAFTDGQAEILGRYSENILLAYDSDEAGSKAALKNIQVLRKNGLQSRIIDLKPYKDPDEFIKNLGKDEFQKRVDNAKESYIYLLSNINDKNSEEFLLLASNILLEENPEEREILFEKFCMEFGIDGCAIKSKMSEIASKAVKPDILSGSLDEILSNLKKHKTKGKIHDAKEREDITP